MGDFYEEMAVMARELLAPTSQGGLGQGTLAIVRRVPTAPVNEWEQPPVTEVIEVLNGAVRGVSSQLVFSGNLGAAGPVILSTDLSATCTPPSIPYQPGDAFTIDGRPVMVIRVDNIPAAGTAVAVRFILRG